MAKSRFYHVELSVGIYDVEATKKSDDGIVIVVTDTENPHGEDYYGFMDSDGGIISGDELNLPDKSAEEKIYDLVYKVFSMN